MRELKLGKYQHYKGTMVVVIGIAEHTETKEKFVVYNHKKEETGEDYLWVRPLKMFLEDVVVDGKKMPRFTYFEE